MTHNQKFYLLEVYNWIYYIKLAIECLRKETKNLNMNFNISLLYSLHSVFPKDNATYNCCSLHLLITSDVTHVQVQLHTNIVAILE
jgi:hypothetical protein